MYRVSRSRTQEEGETEEKKRNKKKEKKRKHKAHHRRNKLTRPVRSHFINPIPAGPTIITPAMTIAPGSTSTHVCEAQRDGQRERGEGQDTPQSAPDAAQETAQPEQTTCSGTGTNHRATSVKQAEKVGVLKALKSCWLHAYKLCSSVFPPAKHSNLINRCTRNMVIRTIRRVMGHA